jgi:choice-of-anchor C domain-containing protein
MGNLMPPSIKVLAAIATIFGACSPASAAVFYSQDFTGGGASYTTINAGGTFDGFTVSSGSIDLIGGYWQAPVSAPGAGSVDLNGSGQGAITLTTNLTTLPAGTYELSFYLSGNPDGTPTTKTLDVSVGNVANQQFTYSTSANGTTKTDMKYVLETVIFTSNGSTPLSFSSLSADSPYGPVIGGLSISSVPEPSTWAMLVLGFLGLGFLAVRQKGSRSVRLA